MAQRKIRLNSFQIEQIPAGAKLFYHHFAPQLIRQACLEYWVIHNFNWTDYTFPRLKFKPTTASDFLSQDYPGDMSDAMSLNAFAELYREIRALPESECSTKIREFCIVVCGIGKTMYLLERWFGRIGTTNEEHLEAAIRYAVDV